MAQAEKKSRSPYVKYGKAPFAYSPLYQQWKSAMLAGREHEARRLGKQHTDKWLGVFIALEIANGNRAA